MRSPARSTGAFSLVELIIVVAIIGALTAMAVPQYAEMQLRARQTEAVNITGSIKNAEIAYRVAFDQFIETKTNPDEPLTKSQRDWDPTIDGWSTLGYAPPGQVRCNYRVRLFGRQLWARVDGTCDLDDDNKTHFHRYYIKQFYDPSVGNYRTETGRGDW